ncbi:MAG: hypothetical protein ACLF0P_15970 [Thermoanaerobaculia bacterium]
MTSVDMSPEAVTQRLRELSRMSDLRTANRLAAKVDMSPEAVTRRLRRQSELRRTCLAWMELGKAVRGGSPGRGIR